MKYNSNAVTNVKGIDQTFNSSPRGQNGRRFADEIFKCIFFNEDVVILIKISLNFLMVQLAIYAFVNRVSIDSDNGLLPVQWQAII